MLSDSQKRMLQNTGMLYARMLLVMAVTLYTSRVMLAVLGVEDFGIYYVVAGFVALLGFMQGAMATATQRYFAFDLGESGGMDLNRIFNTSLLIHGLLAMLIALLAETAGYWFVVTQLTIPDDRLVAALWAYHLAVAGFSISVVTVPFTAMLMAHERMGVFAVIGIVDVLLKLVAVILLQYLGSDKLIAYACLLLLVSMITLMLYISSNKILFPQIKLRWQWHSQQFRTMLSYTAWNTWGNLASALSGQGSNVLLNIFFGPAVNAGKSISVQANGALNNFVLNVQAAINPQIIKLYASGNRAAMHDLVLRVSKYNFFILFTLALPVLLNTDALLGIWLVEVPPYATVFLQLTIAGSLVNSFSGPLMTSAQATGHIRLYHTVVGGLLLLNVPISYLLLRQGFPPEAVLIVAFSLYTVALFVRLKLIALLINLPIYNFIKKVIFRAALVTAAAGCIGYLILIDNDKKVLLLIVNIAVTLIVSMAIIWVLGLSRSEKRNLIQMVRYSIRRLT